MQKVHTCNFQMTHNLSIKISRNALVVSIKNLLFCHFETPFWKWSPRLTKYLLLYNSKIFHYVCIVWLHLNIMFLYEKTNFLNVLVPVDETKSSAFTHLQSVLRAYRVYTVYGRFIECRPYLGNLHWL